MSSVTQDKIAEQAYYDNLFKTRKRFDQFQNEIYQRIAEEARRGTTGKQALEIGCGSGVQAVFLLDQGFSVVAADLSREAIRVARATASESGRTLAVVNADAEALPVKTASVDACICGLCFIISINSTNLPVNCSVLYGRGASLWPSMPMPTIRSAGSFSMWRTGSAPFEGLPRTSVLSGAGRLSAFLVKQASWISVLVRGQPAAQGLVRQLTGRQNELLRAGNRVGQLGCHTSRDLPRQHAAVGISTQRPVGRGYRVWRFNESQRARRGRRRPEVLRRMGIASWSGDKCRSCRS